MTFEQTLGVLADAATRELPKYLVSVQGGSHGPSLSGADDQTFDLVRREVDTSSTQVSTVIGITLRSLRSTTGLICRPSSGYS